MSGYFSWLLATQMGKGYIASRSLAIHCELKHSWNEIHSNKNAYSGNPS